MTTVCRDCGKSANDWYWVTPRGHKLKTPRCPDCHEQASRRDIRDADGNERLASGGKLTYKRGKE